MTVLIIIGVALQVILEQI